MTSFTIDIILSSNNNNINFIVWKSSEDSGGVSGFYYDEFKEIDIEVSFKVKLI